MKGSLFKKILYSSAFLAAVPAVIFLLLLPSLGSKFSLSIEPNMSFEGQITYEDLNSDTISEIIHSDKGLPYYFIAARDYNLRFYDQWNLKDSMNNAVSQFFFGNSDHDLYKEIYVFTYKQDSLFLNVNEMLEHHGTKLERIYITKIGYQNGEVLSFLYPAGFFDENGDGRDEIYFGISSAFGIGPRKIFSYDLVNKRLNSTQFTGTICLSPKMADVDGDNKPEIFGVMSASGNFSTNIPFSDSSTWFMVFNDRLEFEFPPEEFPGFVNSLYVNMFENESFRGYVVSHQTGGTDTTIMKPRIMLYSPDGKLVRYCLYHDLGYDAGVNLMVLNYHKSDRIYLLENKITELNDKLEVIQTVDLHFDTKTYAYQFDINGDGDNELLVYSENDERLLVFNGGLNKLTEVEFKTPDPNWSLVRYYDRNHKHKLFLKSGNKTWLIDLQRNKLYYLGYLAYPGIYILFFLFIFLVKRINTYQVVEKESLKQRLITLQLQGIKAQLDPHFTFNTLNSVASLIYLGDRQAAYDYMNKFTQLLRGMINDAERIYRSLSEELDFVTTYLDLEKLRYGERFNYEIKIGEGINQKELVPKLVLQTFAENAIKHGIMPRPEGGILKIMVEKNNDTIKLTIEDNGIGRINAAGQSTSTGKGLRLTGEFYNILNQINRKPIKYNITDLYDEYKEPQGTRVEVWVPVDVDK